MSKTYAKIVSYGVLLLIIIVLAFVVSAQRTTIEKKDNTISIMSSNFNNCNNALTAQSNAIQSNMNTATQKDVDARVNAIKVVYQPLKNSTCEQLLDETNSLIVGGK